MPPFDLDPFLEKKERVIAFWKKKLRHAKARQACMLLEKTKCEAWRSYTHEGQLLQAFYHQILPEKSAVDLPDWELQEKPVTISLDPKKSLQKNIEDKCLLGRRLKRGEEKVRERLSQTLFEITKYQEMERLAIAAASAQDLKPLLPIASKKEAKSQEKKAPYRTFFSASKLSIFVGKGAKGNDELTFRFAKGFDFWFHIRDYSGAHVVLSTIKGQIPDEEAIQDAALLAFHYSQAKEERKAEVIMTQVKKISRASKLGQVQVASQKVLFIKNDPKRLDAIKSRLI